MTSVFDALQLHGELHTVHSDRMDAKMFNASKSTAITSSRQRKLAAKH